MANYIRLSGNITDPGPIYRKSNGAYAASPIAEDNTLYEFEGDWYYIVKDWYDLKDRVATGNWQTSTDPNQRVDITSNGVTKSILMNNLITTRVTDFSTLFQVKLLFQQNISNWDTENVTNMEWMFYNAKSFNQDIGSWNVKNVSTMRNAFSGAESFNMNIGSWDLRNVTSMYGMFNNATSFNQDIGSSWNVENVDNMVKMFQNATSFNQNLSGWCVSKVVYRDYFDDNTPQWTLPKPNWANPPC